MAAKLCDFFAEMESSQIPEELQPAAQGKHLLVTLFAKLHYNWQRHVGEYKWIYLQFNYEQFGLGTLMILCYCVI